MMYSYVSYWFCFSGQPEDAVEDTEVGSPLGYASTQGRRQGNCQVSSLTAV